MTYRSAPRCRAILFGLAVVGTTASAGAAPPPASAPPAVPPRSGPARVPAGAPARAPVPEPAPASAGAASTGPGTPAPAAGEELDALLGRPGGLTADEAVARALAHSPVLAGRRAEHAAAAAERDRARLAYSPQLTATARYTRLSAIDPPTLGTLVAAPGQETGPVPPGAPLYAVPLAFPAPPVNQGALAVNLSVPLSDYLLRLPRRLEAAEAGEQAARRDSDLARQSLATQTRLLYFRWVLARLQAQVAHDGLAAVRAHLEALRQVAGAGQAGQAELLRAEARVAEAERLAATAAGQATLAEDELRLAMGAPGTAPLAIGDALPIALEPARVAPLDSLVSRALATRLEIGAFDARLRSLTAQRQAQRAAAWPRLDAVASAQLANPHPRVIPQEAEWHTGWDLGVQLTLPLSEVAPTRAQLRVLDARESALRSERAARIDLIRHEVAVARQAALDAHAVLGATAAGERASAEAVRVRRILFGAGEATSSEVLDAERELLHARLARTAARVEVRIAELRLAQAVGTAR